MSALYIMTTTPIEPAQWFDGGELPDPVPAHSGVRWANDADVKALVPHFAQIDCIALQFPAFADGRAYSQARQLRRLGYTGRLRASGKAVVLDQALEIRAASFDEAELREDQSAEQWKQWLATQPADGLFSAARGRFLHR
jgi:uncharacterized protein (DUF934 family)|tara:strand:- start:6932 stop:7351 length:420 start_codon:yes stop_codon:yes gene_type:complete